MGGGSWALLVPNSEVASLLETWPVCSSFGEIDARMKVRTYASFFFFSICIFGS